MLCICFKLALSYVCSPSQLSVCREELERVRGELAAMGVKVSSMEGQLGELKSTAVSKEVHLQQLKVCIEMVTSVDYNCHAGKQS